MQINRRCVELPEHATWNMEHGPWNMEQIVLHRVHYTKIKFIKLNLSFFFQVRFVHKFDFRTSVLWNVAFIWVQPLFDRTKTKKRKMFYWSVVLGTGSFLGRVLSFTSALLELYRAMMEAKIAVPK